MRRTLSRVVAFMSVPDDNPALILAQYKALSRQLPMMYVIIMVSAWAIAITHFSTAPLWLTLYLPCIFTAFSVARLLKWQRLKRRKPDAKLALKVIRSTNRLSYAVAAIFTSWPLLFFPYGDAYTRAHIAFFVSITVMTCIFCLTHVRSAALGVAVIVNGISIVFFVTTGELTFMAIAMNMLLANAGMLVVVMSNYRDFADLVGARVRSDELGRENLRIANLDSLTGLPNRRAFFSELDALLKRASDEDRQIAVGVMDLDGFKPVNDLYGHSTGDKLLVRVAERFSALEAGKALRFFRLGGDEFAFLIDNPGSVEEARQTGETVCDALREPFDLPGAIVQASGSAGIAVFPDTATTPEELFDDADYALYHGKRFQRGQCTLFDGALDAEVHRDALIEQMLKQADLERELDLFFQPIINIADQKTAGFEALARWQSPELGSVPPSQFIPIAEKAGIISGLTQILFRKALNVAKTWPEGTYLSFNLSPIDLGSCQSVLALAAIIEKSGFDPRSIDLEITETAFGHDANQVLESIGMFRDLGCGIVLDDFGTGYSSLNRLLSLPLTKIKIDRGFVTDIKPGAPNHKIVKSLLTLSRELKHGCVVEGVETDDELQTLREIGAVLVQGYYFAKPMSAADAAAHMQQEASVQRTFA